MTRIFISYRRDDDPYAARGINNALCERFGKQQVYFDLHAIRAGFDYRMQIDEMVTQCDVMLVVIGDEWLQTDESGRSRLEDAGDLAGIEVSSALERGIPVIPVLVGRARVPAVDMLPESIRPLSYRQAVEVRATASFDAQIDSLIRQIESAAPVKRSRLLTLGGAIAAAVAAAVVLVVVLARLASGPAEQAQTEAATATDLPATSPIDRSATSPIEPDPPETSTNGRAEALAFDPSAEAWSGEDIFEIEQDLEIENSVVNFGQSGERGFGAQLIAEYPGRRVYRMPEQDVLVETEWSLGIENVLDEPILRRLSTGALIAKLDISSASFNRADGLVAGVSRTDGTLVQVFNASDGRLVHTVHLPELRGQEPQRVDFAPDGLRLFVATYERSWISVRLEDGQVEWSITLPSDEDFYLLDDVSFDRDGDSALLFSGSDRPQRVRLSDGALLGPLLSPPYKLSSMAPHPGGEFGFYGTNNGVICLGRLSGDPEHFCFGDGWGDAVSPAPHHGGRYVAAVFYDRGVVIYDLQERLPVGMIVPQWKVYRTEFEPGSDMLLVHSADKTTLWELSFPADD